MGRKKKLNICVKIKNSKNFLFLIILYFIFERLALINVYLALISIIYFVTRKTFEYNYVEKLFYNAKTLICFWPLIFIVSLFSLYLFNDYQEQVVITRLKEDKAKFEILISSVFISPILEEVFFRFIVYTEFKKKMGIFFGVLFSSLLFSIVHYNIYSFAVIFIVGLICALQFEKTGDIKNSIIIHSLFNLVMVILTLLS